MGSIASWNFVRNLSDADSIASALSSEPNFLEMFPITFATLLYEIRLYASSLSATIESMDFVVGGLKFTGTLTTDLLRFISALCFAVRRGYAVVIE